MKMLVTRFCNLFFVVVFVILNFAFVHLKFRFEVVYPFSYLLFFVFVSFYKLCLNYALFFNLIFLKIFIFMFFTKQFELLLTGWVVCMCMYLYGLIIYFQLLIVIGFKVIMLRF